MLDISFFRGARPKIQPHLLESGEAAKAVNCRLDTGALRSFRGPTTIQATSVANVKTIHKYGDTAFWFEFTDDVNVAEGPIASDTETTTYFTGNGYPSITFSSIATAGLGPYPSNKYRLGVPAPATALVATVAGIANADDELPDSRAYLVTYVSARGEEGPPSTPTAVVDVFDGQSVNLTTIPTAPTGNYNIQTKRIYRTSTASGDTSFQFVAEIPVAQDTYSDTTLSEFLGEVLPSLEWYPPPEGMIGLISCANGVMAGFKGKDYYLSEPYLPHAWPYRFTVNEPIVGLVSIRGGLVVATTGQPVLVSFTNPAAASQMEIESPRSCVSKRSMVDMGDYAIFATAEGLVAVDGSGQSPLITQNVIDQYEWQRLNPSTMHAYRLENWYVCFYQGQAGNKGFAITASGDGFIELDFYATAGYTDKSTAALYLVINNNIVKWDDDAVNLLTYTWRSGTVLLPKPKNMAVARIDAESYPVNFVLLSDDSILYSKTVNSSDPFWLPGNYLTRRYDIELSGSATVRSVIVAESIEELT